jgi:hypothetical protein
MTARPQYPPNFTERGRFVGDVLKNLVQQRRVNARIRQWEVIGTAVVFNRIWPSIELLVVRPFACDGLIDPRLFGIDTNGFLGTPGDQDLGVAAFGTAAVEPDAP